MIGKQMRAARQRQGSQQAGQGTKSANALSRPQVYLVGLWRDIHWGLLLVTERICETLLPTYRTRIERRHIGPRPIPTTITRLVVVLLLLLLGRG